MRLRKRRPSGQDALERIEDVEPAGMAAARDWSAVPALDADGFTIATYNIHSCVGLDGRRDPERVAAVLAELDADIIALQEVDSRRVKSGRGWVDQFEYLAKLTGYHAIPGPNVVDHSGSFGNVVLSRYPVVRSHRMDLSFTAWREPRGAIDVEVALGSRRLRVVATHLGLSVRERHTQVQQLLALLRARADRDLPCVLLGDLNEWRPRGGSLRPLMSQLQPSPQLATFPTWRPLLPLDRIFVNGTSMDHVAAHRSADSRVASDHLPLKAVCSWND